jgi:predicted ATPase
MVLFNLRGGPGAGKTTFSYYLAYRLKRAGFRTELLYEPSRDLIYSGYPDRPPHQLLDNQVLMVGETYERILRLKRHGFEVVVSDSPIVQCLLYCRGHSYYDNLKAVIRDIEPSFDTYNVFITPRAGSYDPESRTQKTEAEARALDNTVRDLIEDFWLEINWDQESLLGDRAVELVHSIRQSLPSSAASSTKAPSQE